MNKHLETNVLSSEYEKKTPINHIIINKIISAMITVITCDHNVITCNHKYIISMFVIY